jgi:hypothetical protein
VKYKKGREKGVHRGGRLFDFALGIDAIVAQFIEM